MTVYKWATDGGIEVPIRINGSKITVPIKRIKLHKKDGTVQTVDAADQENGFALNESIGDITETRENRHCANDSKLTT